VSILYIYKSVYQENVRPEFREPVKEFQHTFRIPRATSSMSLVYIYERKLFCASIFWY